MGCHLKAHLECLQHHLDTIQPFSRHNQPLLHHDNFLAHLKDHELVSQRNNFNQQQNLAGKMLQGMGIRPHYTIFPMTNTVQMM
jgi:hypothetical protein